MSVEKNWWDTLLKRNLYWDLLYRSVIWAGLSLWMAHWAVMQGPSAFGEYMHRTGKSLDVLLNTVGVVVLLLALLADMYKALDRYFPEQWGQDRRVGKFGAVIRSLAGILTMSMAGAFITLLSLGVCIAYLGLSSASEWTYYGVAMTVLLMTIVIMFTIHVVVRGEYPLLSGKLVKTPGRIIGFYLTTIAATSIGVLLRSHGVL